ncbi:class I SAM-dependent RNA methyltransferase [Sneathiella sp.]|uniref:class I SAM-dependent RNA methyltransferase n=1 Tax=Sneathiella sp. TaxID=1964365 RepID=UPI0035660C9E
MMVDLTIDRIGANGDGIAENAGKIYFVPYTAPGDKIRATEQEQHGRGYIAKLDELLVAGPDRAHPSCHHFGTCGGCSLQHLMPAYTATWKRQRIVDCLSLAGINDIEVGSTVNSDPQSRRRVEFIASKRKKGVMIGFHLRRSHQIFDVGKCPLINGKLMDLVNPLRAMLPRVMARNSTAKIAATQTDNGPDVLITADYDIGLYEREALAFFARKNGLSRISWQHQGGDLPEVITACQPSHVRIGDISVALSPGGFLQATEAGELALVNRAIAALHGATHIVDLFAGCGSFTFPLVHRAKVHAVEADKSLITALQSAANKNMLPVTSEERDLFRRPLRAAELAAFDGLLFDPPRAGAKAQAEEIAKSDIPTVVAVSCNPISFARDVGILLAGGYDLISVLPVDQFLWSPHIEMVAVLERPKTA